eukprot:10034724-Alexandrium_andersonii.AAC.1
MRCAAGRPLSRSLRLPPWVAHAAPAPRTENCGGSTASLWATLPLAVFCTLRGSRARLMSPLRKPWAIRANMSGW